MLWRHIQVTLFLGNFCHRNVLPQVGLRGRDTKILGVRVGKTEWGMENIHFIYGEQALKDTEGKAMEAKDMKCVRPPTNNIFFK